MTFKKQPPTEDIDGGAFSRRQFIGYLGFAGLAVSPFGACVSKQPVRSESPRPIPAEPEWEPFLHVEAKGSAFDIGRVVGEKTGHLIRASMDERSEWFADLKQFALADRASRIDGFVKATKHYLPDVMRELEGMAAGSGIDFLDLLILNIRPELGTMKSAFEAGGCSTFHLISNHNNLLVHNEDGHDAYHRRLIVLHGRPSQKPAFVSLVYPGMIGGSVPFMNDAGLFMSTNFIGIKDVNHNGVPRYFLGRGVLDKQTMDEAVDLVTKTVKDRAYSFHLNLGSFPKKRLCQVDTSPTRTDVQETQGLFLQTNHFVLQGTRDLPQPFNTPGGSSDSRYRTLTRLMDRLPAIDEIEEAHLVELLSRHEAVTQPYSPCRHPTESVRSRTLATASFDLNRQTFHLLEGNPCRGRRVEMQI